VKAADSAYTIFSNALELTSTTERVGYIREACADDARLRERVEKLLRAHEQAGGFFSEPLKPKTSAGPSESTVVLTMEKAGDIIGRYKLLEQIGEGGCGVVYMAEQQEPVRRRVALKVIKLGMDTKQVVARFEAERQALAMMDYPNIARVLDAGSTSSGRPYFVMELVRGVKITEFCDRKKVSTNERLELFVRVCHAVQHAHQKGIIHRDLKPSNILVTIVDGMAVPKIIDFGIVKATNNQRLTDKTLFTAFEHFIGTPAYMSPEQAEMSGVDVDTRTDLYSLGVVLYELITGKTPFDAEELRRSGLDEVRRTIREREPPKPSTRLHALAQADLTTTAQARQTDERKLLQSVSGDLDWIVMKCLEKDRSRRYETVNNLARDVERYLKNQPITARPPSRAYQFQKFVRRNRLAFTAITALTMALLVGLGTSMRLFFKEKAAHAREAAMRQRAEEAERRTELLLYSTLVQQAHTEARSAELGHRFRTLQAIRRAMVISNTVELRREAVAALALPDFQLDGELAIPGGALAVLDPAFARVAICDDTKAVEIRSTTDRQRLVTMAPSTNYAMIGKWSADGRYFAIARKRKAGGTYDLEVCDVASGRQSLFVPQLPFGAISFHPTLPRVLFSDRENIVTLRDLEAGRAVDTYAVSGLVYYVEFSPDGQRFAVQHGSPNPWTTSIVDVGSGVASLSMTTGLNEGIAWHPDNTRLALAATSGEVILCDRNTGQRNVLGRHKKTVQTVNFSPGGDFLLSGGDDHEVICWNVRAMRRAFGVPLQAMRAQFHRDGTRAAVVGRNEITFYAFQQSLVRRELDAGPGSARCGVFSPDGRWLAVGSGYNRLSIWDLRNMGPAFSVTPPSAMSPNVMTPFFSPDGSELYATWEYGVARWRVSGGYQTSLRLNPLPVFAPRLVVCGGFSGDSLVLGTGPGIVVLPPDAITSGPGSLYQTGTSSADVSPNGRWISIRKRDPHRVDIYRLEPWKGMRFVETDGEVLAQAFTPRSDELAIGTHTSVTFLDTNRWEVQRRFPVSLDRNARIIFSPVNDTFWLVRDVRTAALHDSRTFETLLPLPAGTIPLAVSADGRQLAVSVDGDHLQLWDLAALRKQLVELGLDWKPTAASAPLGGSVN
jgi:serine/threonine protein kinase/WD40 repeat protein